jgi:hypothetical protein
MKNIKYIVSTICPADASLVGSHCSGSISANIRRPVLFAGIFATIVVLTTGCSSTGTGFRAGLISPVQTDQRTANPGGEDSWYQSPRSPGFDADLFGS